MSGRDDVASFDQWQVTINIVSVCLVVDVKHDRWGGAGEVSSETVWKYIFRNRKRKYYWELWVAKQPISLFLKDWEDCVNYDWNNSDDHWSWDPPSASYSTLLFNSSSFHMINALIRYNNKHPPTLLPNTLVKPPQCLKFRFIKDFSKPKPQFFSLYKVWELRWYCIRCHHYCLLYYVTVTLEILTTLSWRSDKVFINWSLMFWESLDSRELWA